MEKEAPKGKAPKPEALKVPQPKPEELAGKILFGEGKPTEEEKPKKKKAEKEVIAKETLDIFKQRLEQQPDSKLVKKLQQRLLSDQRVVGILNELLEIKEGDTNYPDHVINAARRLKDVAVFNRTDLNAPVYKDALWSLQQLEEAYSEYPQLKNQLKHFMEDAMPVVKGGAPTAVDEIIGPAGSADPLFTNANLAEKLREYQDYLKMDKGDLHDTHKIAEYKEQFKREARKQGWDSALAQEGVDRLQKVADEVDSILAAQSHRMEKISSMFLTDTEKTELNENPRWMVERFLRKVERTSVLFPSGPIAEAAQRRLGLMGEYFSHEQFLIDVDEYIQKHLDEYPDGGIKHRADMAAVAQELSEKVNFRTNIQKVYGMIRGLGDPEKISSTLIDVGEGGLEFLLNENGGLVDVAFNKYVHLLKQARFDSNGNLRRLTPDVLYEIRDATVAEMRRDRALYNQMYKDADNGFKRDLMDDDCEAIVGLAEFGVVMTEQNLVAMLGGLGPGETFGKADLSSFLSAGPEEQILGAMDIQRWFFEKWTNLKPAQRVMWENGCRFAAQAGGRMELIEERLKGVTRGDARFTEIATNVFGKDDAGRLRTLLEYDAEGHQRKNLPKSFKEVSMKDLRDRLIVAEGEKVIGEMLTVYDHFSSGWRLDTHLKQIDAIWGEDGENLGLGFRLREAGANLLKAEEKEAKAKAQDGLRKVLGHIAKYRPQALFEFLNDGKNESAKAWLDAGRQARFSRAFGEQVSRSDQVYKLIGRRFVAINELLAEAGFPPIDYSSRNLSPDQMNIIKKVCGHMETNVDGYLDLMREMSGFVIKDAQISELTTDQYLPVYRRTRWLDDSRLRYLENPDTAPGAKVEKGKLLGISKRFTYSGRGSADPLVRTWRDTNLAVKTVLEVMASLTTDRKALQKALMTINANVRQYSGEPYGSRAVFYLLAGWGRTAKTDAIKDFFFLNIAPNSSAAKRLLGDDAPSMGLNELEHLIDEYDLALMSKMKLLAPEMAKDIENYLGISGKFLGKAETRLPLYLYRARIFIALAAVIIILQGLKDVNKEMSDH